MSEIRDIDPLAQLWQSAPEPDPRQLVLDLKRLQAVHRRQNRVVLLIVCATALLLAFGAVAVRSVGLGVITALWVAVMAGVVGYQRARCRAADALDLDTLSLLRRMIKRAKRGLTQARRLYAGVPLAAAVGWGVTRVFVSPLALDGHIVRPWLVTTYTIVSLVMLVAVIAAGLVLARARQRQLGELRETLRLFEEGL